MTADGKNRKTAFVILGVVVAMIGLSFAAVPMYRLFCRVTGFGGTPQMGASQLPAQISARVVTVSFDARVDAALPWDFKPEKRRIDVHVGQQGLINFTAHNLSARDTVGTAVYNITPEKAGKYFYKTQCFCFAEQTLKPGGAADFPVLFYLDPALLDDEEMEDVTDITLSYTFFPAGSEALDRAITEYGMKEVK